MGVSGNLWIVVKDVKTLVVYDVDQAFPESDKFIPGTLGLQDFRARNGPD